MGTDYPPRRAVALGQDRRAIYLPVSSFLSAAPSTTTPRGKPEVHLGGRLDLTPKAQATSGTTSN